MDYVAATNRLLMVFQEHDFEARFRRGNFLSMNVPVHKCTHGAVISVTFPGTKTKIGPSGLTSDYRVDFTKGSFHTVLSHANLIVDIFNKCTQGGVPPAMMAKALALVARVGLGIWTRLPQEVLTYSPKTSPSPELLSRADSVHRSTVDPSSGHSKVHNQEGNLVDLDSEELLHSLFWIVLQEDVNYPISKGYKGRQMPFERYAEAIWCAKAAPDRIDEVIRRALAHVKHHSLWDGVDYTCAQGLR